MPRSTSRERNVRRDPSLRDGARPVQLNESRRFQTASGFEGATRTAKALQNAFGVGTGLYTDIVEKRNTEGAEQAAFEEASGGVRGQDNKTKGYNDMWDSIEASNDLHLFSKALPEVLRGADWENLTEDEAQGVIDGYYQEQLKGINPNSVYGQKVAEGILQQNAQLLDTHRNFQLQRIHQEQRVMIYNEALATFETDGAVDYDTIAARTGVAFDGAEKMTTFWEVIYDLAIDAGDESIIEQVPERFPSGDPTGINDPRLLADHNTAISKAIAKREAGERAAAAAAKAEKERIRNTAKTEMIGLIVEGDIDPTATALDYARNGVVEAEDITAVATAYRNIRDDRAKQGFNPGLLAQLQTQIAIDPTHEMLDPNNLLLAFSEGAYGDPRSPQAKTAFRQMLQDRESARERRERVNSDPRKKTWVNRFDESFPIPKNEFGFPAPGVLTELRAEYSAEFEMAILEAKPSEYRTIFDEFAKQYKDAEKLTTAIDSAGSPTTTFRQTLRGNLTPEQAAAHARNNGWTVDSFIQARESGELEITDGTTEGETYKALLQALLNE